MLLLGVSGAVRPIYLSLGVKRLILNVTYIFAATIEICGGFMFINFLLGREMKGT